MYRRCCDDVACYCFFFSSRRRHTRLVSDWSSDVCSSDLVEREWSVEGVVRAVLPEIHVLVLTHGEIPGYMPAMTMGFRAASPKITDSIRVGDAVRFTLRGVPPNVMITAIENAK